MKDSQEFIERQMSVKRAIKGVIKSKGYTIEQLAKEMSSTQSALSQVINGNPSLDKLIEISLVLKVSMPELLGLADTTALRCPHCGREIRLMAL